MAVMRRNCCSWPGIIKAEAVAATVWGGEEPLVVAQQLLGLAWWGTEVSGS